MFNIFLFFSFFFFKFMNVHIIWMSRTFIFGKYYLWHYNKLAHDTLDVVLFFYQAIFYFCWFFSLSCISSNSSSSSRKSLEYASDGVYSSAHKIVHACKVSSFQCIYSPSYSSQGCSFKRHMQKCHEFKYAKR